MISPAKEVDMNGTFGTRNLGDILSETFRVYGRSFWRLVAIVAIVEGVLCFLWFAVIVAGLIPIAIGGGGFDYSDPMEALFLFIPMVVMATVLTVVSVVAAILMQGALVHAISEQYFKQPVNIGQAYRFAWRRMGSLIGAGFLAGLVIMALCVTVIGIPAGIYFAITWAFIWQAALLEGCGPRAALRRSSALVKESWWRVLGVMLLFGLIAGAISGVLGIIPVLGSIVGAILSAPIAIIGSTLLYYDLRVRKEGYSLEVLAGELGVEISSDTARQ